MNFFLFAKSISFLYSSPQKDNHHVFRRHCRCLCHHGHPIWGVFIDGDCLPCHLHQHLSHGVCCNGQVQEGGLQGWVGWSLQELQRMGQNATLHSPRSHCGSDCSCRSCCGSDCSCCSCCCSPAVSKCGGTRLPLSLIDNDFTRFFLIYYKNIIIY